MKVFSLVEGGINIALTYKGMYKNYALFDIETNLGGGVSSSGILNLSMRSSDEGFDKNRILLAGTGMWVGKLKMEAKYEDIEVKDLKFKNSNIQAVDSVKEVCLYKAKTLDLESLVACAPMSDSGVIPFENLGYVSNQGTQFLYMYVTSNFMDDTLLGLGTVDTHDVIELALEGLDFNVVAKGVNSGEILTFGGANGIPPQGGQYVFDYDLDGIFNENQETKTANTPKFIVSGSRISDVKLVNSYSGEYVNSVLSGMGQYTVGILGITNEANSNTTVNGSFLKLGIDSIRFDVEKSYGLKISDVTLQRIGGFYPAIHMNLFGLNELVQTKGTAVAYDILYNLGTDYPNDAQVNSGETAYFAVKAIVDKLSTSTENYVSFNMNDVQGTYNYDIDNNIDWLADSTNSSTLFNATLIDIDSLKGTKLQDSN